MIPVPRPKEDPKAPKTPLPESDDEEPRTFGFLSGEEADALGLFREELDTEEEDILSVVEVEEEPEPEPDGPPEEKASEPEPLPTVKDTRPLTDGDTDWRGADEGFQTVPVVKPEPQPEPTTIEPYENTLPDATDTVVKPEVAPQAELPFNATSGTIDLTKLWEDFDKVETDLLEDLAGDEADKAPIGSVVDPVPRRSERIRAQPQPMTYREPSEAEVDRLNALKDTVLQNIMQWVPKKLKMEIFDNELMYFGIHDAYIHTGQFYAGNLKGRFILPAEIMAEERDDEQMLDKLEILEEMVDYFSEDVQEDVQTGMLSVTSVKSSFYQQVAIALVIKHTIRLICEGAGFPDRLWKTGEGAFAGYDMAKVHDNMELVVGGLQREFGEGWPAHFINIPKFLPMRLPIQLNQMAGLTFNESMDAAVRVHELLLSKEWLDETEVIELDPPSDVSEEPIVCERPQADIPVLEDEAGVTQIRKSLRDIIDEQITLRVEVKMPPPPPPPVTGPVAVKEEGYDYKWLFGILLTLWLSYQMD